MPYDPIMSAIYSTIAIVATNAWTISCLVIVTMGQMTSVNASA